MAKGKSKEKAVAKAPEAMPKPRLKDIYKRDVAPKLMEQYKYKSPMQVPRITKVVVNIGTGIEDKERESAIRDLTAITGQKPVTTYARQSIANFKIREGMPIGTRVTLRGDRALFFFDKLCTVALPKLRDFQGLSPKSFDGRGNYSLGLKEQLVFPEIDYESFDRIRGMDITVVTTAKTDDEARTLLKLMGMPLREK